MSQKRYLGQLGLTLSRQALRVLKDRGIFVQSAVSLEHQHLAERYVIRGLESGGAAGDLGRYVTFAQPDGQPIEYLHPVEVIGVNDLHAVVIAPALVRLEMLRKERTYELLITQHRPREVCEGKRPALESKVLFRGVHGRLELDLSGKDKSQSGAVEPTFYSMAGEEVIVPKRFQEAVRAVTRAVNCIECSHCHYARVPKDAVERAATVAAVTQFDEAELSLLLVALNTQRFRLDAVSQIMKHDVTIRVFARKQLIDASADHGLCPVPGFERHTT